MARASLMFCIYAPHSMHPNLPAQRLLNSSKNRPRPEKNPLETWSFFQTGCLVPKDTKQGHFSCMVRAQTAGCWISDAESCSGWGSGAVGGHEELGSFQAWGAEIWGS